MKNIKIGIIGTIFSAEDHLFAYNLVPNIEIVGITGSSLEKALEFMKK
jgi:predicted dehydrogenase